MKHTYLRMGQVLLLGILLLGVFTPMGIGTYAVGAFLPPIKILPFLHPTSTASILEITPLKSLVEAARWETERSVIRATLQAHCGLGTTIQSIRTTTHAFSEEEFGITADYPLQPDDYHNRLTEELGAVDETLWEDFVAQNWETYPLPADVIQNAQLASDFSDYTDISSSPRKCGVLHLSRAGFNQNGTQALIYIGETCDGWCGIGMLYWLEKKHDVWMITGERMVWIA